MEAWARPLARHKRHEALLQLPKGLLEQVEQLVGPQLEQALRWAAGLVGCWLVGWWAAGLVGGLVGWLAGWQLVGACRPYGECGLGCNAPGRVYSNMSASIPMFSATPSLLILSFQRVRVSATPWLEWFSLISCFPVLLLVIASFVVGLLISVPPPHTHTLFPTSALQPARRSVGGLRCRLASWLSARL